MLQMIFMYKMSPPPHWKPKLGAALTHIYYVIMTARDVMCAI